MLCKLLFVRSFYNDTMMKSGQNIKVIKQAAVFIFKNKFRQII